MPPYYPPLGRSPVASVAAYSSKDPAMILYFLRHGIAVEPSEWQGPDDDRPLTKEGIGKMKDEARAIADLSLRIDVVVSSPLLRACTTATLVSRKLKGEKPPLLDDRLAAGFSLDALREIAGEHAGAEGLLLVGHEPTLSSVIGHLIGSTGIVMKKGALAAVAVDDAQCTRGDLIALIPPRVLTALGKARSR
jgi:phosphohistidine phosphatase